MGCGVCVCESAKIATLTFSNPQPHLAATYRHKKHKMVRLIVSTAVIISDANTRIFKLTFWVGGGGGGGGGGTLCQNCIVSSRIHT